MKTTITIDDKLARELNQLKYQYGYKTIEEVIQRYLKTKVEHTAGNNPADA